MSALGSSAMVSQHHYTTKPLSCAVWSLLDLATINEIERKDAKLSRSIQNKGSQQAAKMKDRMPMMSMFGSSAAYCVMYQKGCPSRSFKMTIFLKCKPRAPVALV